MKHLIDIHKFRNSLAYLVEFESFKILKLNGFAWDSVNAFPHGACCLSSNLLGVYLLEQGCSDVKLIIANVVADEFPDIKSHAWLEVDGKYVDITSSQFSKRTNDRITIQNKCPAGWLFSYAEAAKREGNYIEKKPDHDDNLSLYNLIVSKINCM